MLSFIFVVMVLFLIPGPAVLLTVSQTAQGGRKAGVITGVGIAVGDLLHTIAAVLGLSAILMTSALAFEVVKYAGAAYLIFLGIKSVLEKSKNMKKPVTKKSNPAGSFRQALLIELLNPKTALFFLAFLPQFVRSNGIPVVYQLLILGLTFVLMSILYTTMLAFLTSSIGNKLFSTKNSRFARWQGKVVGIIYIGLGLQLVFQSQK
ncbi:LysE family translocator [Neobacillus sp. MM2021_6]|uniref:LysE family translocator n=1 Tax=Bacillaceae TaxID=186817 RepID=UPI00140CA95B|nr:MULTISPECIES: LysE family translocator [Bacillaceae]MBO0958629.1 LysE family translocator [Neobacillus sp. MM2021_6]NHC20230.1 LysE family translocator [Bacillus sp. MM2020_4]WML41273.1 LysE family translocator [Neobacillus sp. OS1-2]